MVATALAGVMADMQTDLGFSVCGAGFHNQCHPRSPCTDTLTCTATLTRSPPSPRPSGPARHDRRKRNAGSARPASTRWSCSRRAARRWVSALSTPCLSLRGSTPRDTYPTPGEWACRDVGFGAVSSCPSAHPLHNHSCPNTQTQQISSHPYIAQNKSPLNTLCTANPTIC